MLVLSRGAMFGAASVIALIASSSAWAQSSAGNTEADQPGGLEDIVVTAQFRSQNVQDTPLAITAVSSEMLEARSQTSIADVANQAPSVTLKPQGTGMGPALSASIRGVGQFDFNPALEPGVGVYVDDVYYATLTGSIFDLLDLDRVELLRGPQGTLAGKNSIGGAIKLYSKKPTGDGSGSISATYGSRNRVDLRGSADFALTDNLFMRVAGVAKRQDGYIDRLDFACVNPPGSALNPAVGGVAPQASTRGDCVVGHESDVGYNAFRAQVRWLPSEKIEINLIADYTDDDHTVSGQVLTYADNADPAVRGNSPNVPYDSRFICGPYCNYATNFAPGGPFAGSVATGYPLDEVSADGRSKFRGYGFSGQVDIELADALQLQSITAYRSYNSKFTSDDDLSPLAVGLQKVDLDFWSFSQELRLNGSIGDGELEYTLGGFYQDQRSNFATIQDIRYAGIPLQFLGNDPVNADTKAAFAHLSWRATDRLTLTAGLRYTKEHKDYTFRRLSLDGTLNPFLNPPGNPIDGKTGTYDGDRVDYRANVQYEFSRDLMAYAQVSTGFKGGGVSPRPFVVEQVVPFGPEKLTAYEIGFKSELLDRRARLNVAAFYSDYKGIQLTLLSCPQYGGPGPCAVPANAGDAHIKGIEAELSLRPVDGLSIDGAVSYVDFKYTSINPLAGGPSNPTGPQLDGVPPYTPKWKWSAGAQYEIDLGDSGSVTPRIDAAYQGTMSGGASNNVLENIPHYMVANGRITWRNGGRDLEISGEVTNLFDKYYYLTAYDLSAAGAGFAAAQPGRPREWALTVKKKF